MKKLIQLELERFELKLHLMGLVIANIIILFLSIFTFTLFTSGVGVSIAPGLPTMLVRATLIVWEAVLISTIIIEEYRNKTIGLLFTYPVSRTRLILVKVIMICGIMLAFHIYSSIFQNICIFFLSGRFEFITYSFESLFSQIIVTISTILLGMFPLFVGMVKKSTIATVISSLIIVSVASNSQGTTAGLMSVPVIAVIFGIIGVIFSTIAIRKMITSDLYN